MSDEHKFDFDGESITVHMKGGEVDSAWGNHKYTYDELLKLFK
jgi:hypothetical protein